MFELLHRVISDTETLAIICLFGIPGIGFTISSVVRQYFRHTERMEMIAQGIHPDWTDAQKSDEDQQP